MNNTNRYHCLLYFVVLGVLGLMLFACSSGQPTPSPTETVGLEATSLPTLTPSSTATPTQEAPSVILLAPLESDPVLADKLESTLSTLAAQDGQSFQVLTELSPADLDEEVRVVVALGPDPGLALLAASAPDTKFLAVGMPDVQPAANLITIASSGDRPDRLGFAAGYLAAAITEDWRVGVVSGQETPAGKAAELGFTNGVYFLCGLCRPVFPPFPIPGYPLTVQLPQSAAQADWQTAIEYFQAWQVGTVYVAPEISDPELLRELADAGINIIGIGPPPAEFRSNWVASIGVSDPVSAVQDIWQALLETQGDKSVELPLVLTDVNPELVSPGRQHLVEEMLVDLLAGYIDTGVDPNTGENRFTD